jgi:hypothetical protein
MHPLCPAATGFARGVHGMLTFIQRKSFVINEFLDSKMLRVLFSWIALTIGFGVTAFLASGGAGSLILVRGWKVAEGRVVETTPNSHGRVTIAYEANATPFRHQFSGQPEAVGDRVTVYYAEGDPSLASLEQPRNAVGVASAISIVAGVLFGTLFTPVIFNRTFSNFIRAYTFGSFASPRVVMVLMLIGILVASLVQVAGRPRSDNFWISTLLALTGVAFMAFQSISIDTWYKTVRSKTFAIGAALVILAEMTHLLFGGVR